MTRFLAASALALSLVAGATAARAQSYTAPAGIPAETAPGYAPAPDAGLALGAAPRGYQSLPARATGRHPGRTERR